MRWCIRSSYAKRVTDKNSKLNLLDNRISFKATRRVYYCFDVKDFQLFLPWKWSKSSTNTEYTYEIIQKKCSLYLFIWTRINECCYFFFKNWTISFLNGDVFVNLCYFLCYIVAKYAWLTKKTLFVPVNFLFKAVKKQRNTCKTLINLGSF